MKNRLLRERYVLILSKLSQVSIGHRDAESLVSTSGRDQTPRC